MCLNLVRVKAREEVDFPSFLFVFGVVVVVRGFLRASSIPLLFCLLVHLVVLFLDTLRMLRGVAAADRAVVSSLPLGNGHGI